MSYVNEIIDRMNLFKIRHFLLNGTEDCAEEIRPYRETLSKSTAAIYDRIETLYDSRAERDKVASELTDALTAYEMMYTELGMKAGARLVYQLLLADDLSPIADMKPEVK